MLDIYICEDEDYFRTTLIQKIKNNIAFSSKNMQIVYDTADPYQLLDRLKGNKNKNVYFLDVFLNTDIDGIELASKIRKIDPTGYIVFVTADSQSYKKTFEYRVQALGYIEKSVNLNLDIELDKILNHIDNLSINQNEPDEDTFSFKSIGQTVYLNKNDIVMIKVQSSEDKKLSVLTMNANYTINGTLKRIENTFITGIYSDFVKPHQSYILNLKFIAALKPDRCILLVNDVILQASRRHFSKVKIAFTAYQKRNA